MENKFVDGLFVSRRENAPDFVDMNLSFKSEQFIEYLKANTNEKGYCNVDILTSKEGKKYAKLNDWKPTEKSIDDINEMVNPTNPINISDIPFN